jgi:DNA-binding MarR family transcriptional regulator
MAQSSRPRRAPRNAPRRKLTQSDYEALGAFRLALRKFLAFSEAEARVLGLTPQQHQALLAIRTFGGEGPISVGQLAESLLIKNHSALGLVARLEERGLVARREGARDRRRVVLKLTPPAEKMLETISRNNLGKLKSTLPVFTDLLHALEQLDLPAPGPDRRPDATEVPGD